MDRSFWICAAISLTLSGCASAEKYGDGPMQKYDKNTELSVIERADGYTVNVYYSRYQFVPESDAVSASCRQQATSIAWEEARKRGKEIKPITDQEVKISMGRNGLSGITSCSASVPVYYK